MKIIVVGCGKVGAAVTASLCSEDHSVTVVDQNKQRVEEISNINDVYGVVGNGASISVLQEADVENTDLLIAMTGNDELNLLCCLLARKISKCKTISRIHNPLYQDEITYVKDDLGLAMLVNSEAMAAREIARIFRFPSAKKIESFAKGRVELMKYKIPEESPLSGLKIMEIGKHLDTEVLICAVERGENVTIPGGEFELQCGDVISLVSTPKKAVQLFRKIGIVTNKISSCMLVGGGGISYYLAKELLSMGMRVTIVEKDPERCRFLSEELYDAMTIQGNAVDENVLYEEGIRDVDAFCALTNIDETNILLSLFAKKHTEAKLVTKVHTISYDDIISSLDLDSIICPKNVVAENVLQYVRALQNSMGSNVETLYNIIEGKAEALEFIVRGNCSLVGVPLKDLPLKKGLIICCISSGKRIEIPNGNSVISEGDSVVVVTTLKGLNDIKDILK